MKNNEEMLKEASYFRLVLKLCIPSIIIMLVMVIYNMADTFFIGQTNDANKIAALSLSGPVFSILSGLGTLFGNGGCTAISLSLGKKDYSAIKSYTTICFFGAMGIGLLLVAVTAAGLRPVASALGADEDTIVFTMNYLRIIGFGAPFITFNNVFCNIIRSDGAATESMICNLLGTILNILLDAVFIMGFSWGVTGAALATVTGNACSSAYLLWYIFRKNRALAFHPKYMTIKKEFVVPVLTLGIPMAAGTLLMSVSNIISNNLMIHYGAVALAAQGVAGRIGMLITMLMMGLCMGLQPAISYNYSCRQKKRLMEILSKTAIMTLVIGSILTLLCFLFRNRILLAFIDSDEVIAYGQVMVIASILIGPIYGIYQLCQTFLQATGKASYAIFVSLLDKGIIFIPILFIMNYFWGMYGIAFTSSVTTVFSIGAAVGFSLKWGGQIQKEIS